MSVADRVLKDKNKTLRGITWLAVLVFAIFIGVQEGSSAGLFAASVGILIALIVTEIVNIYV